jgi:hypothetical protein
VARESFHDQAIESHRALWGLAVGAVVGALAMAIPTQLDPDD